MPRRSEQGELRLVAVGKRYHRRDPAILRHVQLTAPHGAIVHVRGDNGSGKSTLLRLIAGVSAPSMGRVVGRPRVVGYVPERFPPTVRFTPRQYLRHLSRVRGVPPERGLELLDKLGGANLGDVVMTELSKGSCQKVAVSQALMGNPELLVLDEAWTGLDAGAQTVLLAEVRKRCDRGGIIVLTDHARRVGAIDADVGWLVADGNVVVESAIRPAGALVEVELVGSSERPDPTGLAGVIRTKQAAGAVRLDVERDHCDALLAEVLKAGWSVRRVGPTS